MINSTNIPEQFETLKAWSSALPYPTWKRMELPLDLFSSVSEPKGVGVTGEYEEFTFLPVTQENIEATLQSTFNANEIERIKALREQAVIQGIGNKFTSYAMTHFTQGALVFAPRNKRGELTISHTLSHKDLISHYLLVAESGSHLEVVLDFNEGTEEGKLYTQVIVWAQPGSQVKVVNLQRLSDEAQSYQNLYALAEEGAHVTIADVQLGSRLKASNVHKRLEGRRTEGEVYSLYYAGENAQADFSYTLNHAGKKTNGHILSKGALSKQSKKVFRGNLIFDRGATQSVSKEEEFCMLLGDQIKADSIPGLFCSEDDVIGEHAASIGQIDLNRLFYLQSRGFTEEAARQLVIRGAYEEVLLKVGLADVTSRVQESLNRLLQNGRAI